MGKAMNKNAKLVTSQIVLLERLTRQDVHIAVLGGIAGLFGLFHSVPHEYSGDALKATANDERQSEFILIHLSSSYSMTVQDPLHLCYCIVNHPLKIKYQK